MKDLEVNQTLAETVGSVIRRRRTCRHYTDRPVTDDVLNSLVEAGIFAPSASNSQNVRFLVITDKEALRRLDRARFVWPYKSYERRRDETEKPGIIGAAPAAILVYADASLTGFPDGREYHVWKIGGTQNACAAMQNILLAATALGLGTCWISASDNMAYSRLLGGFTWQAALPDYDIPADHHIQGIITVGYPKHTDEDGFPAGEGMHGADWTTTLRGPVGEYLIKPRSEGGGAVAWAKPPASSGKRLVLRGLSVTIGLLGRAVQFLEKLVMRLEKPHLTGDRTGKRPPADT
ncbi:MAG: nitroreductase family protein [Pseudomonadota bacterium]